jgi:hypothetical protein
MTLGFSLDVASFALFGTLAVFSGCSSSDASGPTRALQADAAPGEVVPSGVDAAAMASRDATAAADADPPPHGDATALGANDSGTQAEGASGATEAAAAPSPCAASSGLLFCDDFEGATTLAPPAPWSTSIIGSGTVTVDGTTPAHSGTKSIHVSDGDADYDTLLVLHDASVLPAPAARFYVRAYVRLGAAMSAGHNGFILADVFALQGASQGQSNDLRLGEDDQMLMYTVMGDAHGALSNANYYNDGMLPGVQFTPGAWTCLEVLLDSKAPEIDVWVGGAEVPDLHHKDFPLDNYDRLRFGFEKYAGPAMDVWFDDIAIGTQPIGCE